MPRMDVTMKIAEGLDALTNGRGFDIHHERARVLANTAPELLLRARTATTAWTKGELKETMIELRAVIVRLDELHIGETFPAAVGKE